MCECISNAIKKIEQNGFEEVEAPIELLSGRLYIEFIGKKKGQKKTRKIPVLLSRCPFCGGKYKDDERRIIKNCQTDSI